ALETDLLTAPQGNEGGRQIDGLNQGLSSQLDVLILVEALVVSVGLRVGLAPQVVLGERRALIRTLGLLADQDDAPVEALASQGFGGLRSGEARSRDDEGAPFPHGPGPLLRLAADEGQE